MTACLHSHGACCWLCSNQVEWWAEARLKALEDGRITPWDLSYEIRASLPLKYLRWTVAV